MIDDNYWTAAPWLTLMTGHYGVGKTNVSLNVARSMRVVVPRVTLIDLDIVNPYFRTTDNQALLDTLHIDVLGPVYGASNLDTPSLAPGIDEEMRGACAERLVLVDVGGDPEGARALGRYAATIAARPYRMVYLANFNRPETATVKANLELLRGIEAASGLTVTAILGNTHLKQLTTAQDIAASFTLTRTLALEAQLPLLGITAPTPLASSVEDLLVASGGFDNDACEIRVYPVDPLVGAPWET